METISLKQLSKDEKILLVVELGYQTDGKIVLDKNGSVLKDKYIDQPISIENMLILPGSTLILDDNEISILGYIEDYGDKF